MTLQQFIKEKGCRQLAQEFSIAPNTVYSWLRFRNCPAPHWMHQLVKASKGKVSYAEIVEPYLKNRNKN